MMGKSRIYVAGGDGWTSTCKSFKKQVWEIITRVKEDLNLLIKNQSFFAQEKIDEVYLAAAVGGIVANNTYPAEFYMRTL